MPTRKTAKITLNPKGRKAWREDGPTQGKCVWQMHDVWGWDTKKDEGVVLRESYFINNPKTGKKVCFRFEELASWPISRILDRLVYRFLLPLPSQMDGSRTRSLFPGENNICRGYTQ